ncbi:MAG: hypothetical protein SFX73_29110 [Kofleriaceae bacterium]|nr:hypothetical protein [Kofleriaceae bacterium]
MVTLEQVREALRPGTGAVQVGTAIAANAVLAVAWIVATPPVVERALAPAPEMRAFITVHTPRKLDCAREASWDEPAPVRWVRFERDATQSLRGLLANEAFLQPVEQVDHPVIYFDAADDLVRGKVAPETLLVMAVTANW